MHLFPSRWAILFFTRSLRMIDILALQQCSYMSRKIGFILFIFILSFWGNFALSQSKAYVDSLKRVLKSEKSEEKRIELYNELSWELSLTDFDAAHNYASRALRAAKGKYPVQEATAYNRLGTAYDYHGDYALAVDNYQRSYTLRMRLNDTLGASNALLNIGACYYYQGVYSKALHYYTRAAKFKEKVEDRDGLSMLLNNIGLIYRVQKNYPKAIESLKASLKLKQELKDVKGEINTISNLGIIYQNTGECDKAIYYSDLAYTLSAKIASTYDLHSSRVNQGFAQLCKGNNREALAYFDGAKKELLGTDDIQTLAFCCKGRGEAFYAMKHYQKALDALVEAEQFALKAGRRELLSEIYKIRSTVQNALGQPAEALEDYTAYIVYRDSVFSEENTRQLNELESIYESEKKQKKIDQLTQSSRLKEQQLKNSGLRTRLFQVIIVSVSIFLILALYLLWNKQSVNRVLAGQNDKIAEALQQKELLLKEIHHRVKNNLQIVNGLLELQGDAKGDELSPSTIQVAQNRIKSMAFIHEMLYQNSDYQRIEVGSYFTRLLDSLELGYTYHTPLEKTIESEALSLHVDTLIPIGLVVNELVTNSYKYVYTPGLGKHLFISLTREGDAYQLIIRDDGPGLPEGVIDFHSHSFGLRLVKMMMRQLGGTISYRFHGGAEFTCKFHESTSHHGEDRNT